MRKTAVSVQVPNFQSVRFMPLEKSLGLNEKLNITITLIITIIILK